MMRTRFLKNDDAAPPHHHQELIARFQPERLTGFSGYDNLVFG